MKNLVSVIIPTHMGAHVINNAVDSVLAQTYENIEVIVVDDNGRGTEEQVKTAEKMELYSTGSKVSYYVHETSRHGAAARNTGINQSRGNYISFLDDDDVFLPNNIEMHMKVLKDAGKDVAMSYCGLRLVRNGFDDETVMPVEEGDLLFHFLMSRINIGSSQIVIRKRVLEEVRGFDESFRRHQDWELIARILYLYKIVKVDNAGVVKFVLGRNSASSPQIYEKNRIYYLNKSKRIIDSFPPEQKKQIYNNHYYYIAKEYMKSRHIRIGLKWFFKTNRPIYFLMRFMIDGGSYALRRMKI